MPPRSPRSPRFMQFLGVLGVLGGKKQFSAFSAFSAVKCSSPRALPHSRPIAFLVYSESTSVPLISARDSSRDGQSSVPRQNTAFS